MVPRCSPKNLGNGSDRFRLFAKRPTQVASLSKSHLPLHVQNPPVPFLSRTKADKLITLGSAHGDEKVWFASTAVYRDEAAAKELFRIRDSSRDVNSEAKLFGSDLQLLLESNFAIDTRMSVSEFETEFDNEFLYVKLFSAVEERASNRRRIIALPESFNSAEQHLAAKLLEESPAI